ncbi:glycine oxidase ThiO [Corynebacterium lubricantis]|uniref:glycine oxidase ThiO n=1 Tax=Corynebacterium lubricantis TaxID=541095 RepID=UPI000382D27E|nr:glycine oxidase ThiO [Corynebacterium lubricantis]
MPKHAIVIGGGIIGLATCFEYQEAGYEVTLIDPDPISGATHHAGGMLAPTAEVQYQQHALLPLMQESARLYPSLIQRVSEHTDLPTGYRTDGTLLVGADRADATHLSDIAHYLEQESVEVDKPTTRQARALEPALSPSITKALRIDGDHQVAPRLFARALLDAITHRGAEIIRDRVVALEGNSRCEKVRCENSTLESSSSDIVLAAGLGVARIEGAPQLNLRPVYGDILNLRVPEAMRPLITRVIRGFVEDRPVYLIPRDNGLLTIGATSREDAPTPRAGAVYDLLRDAIRLVPGIEECEFVEATCGARPGTPDDLPYLGRVGENQIVSTGYFRHGILLAALGARSTVALSQGGEPPVDLSACDPCRHTLTERQAQ